MALCEGSAAWLRDAILAEAICAVGRDSDPREVMVNLAPIYYVAQRIGHVPSDLLDEIASCLSGGWVPDLLREAGASCVSSVPVTTSR